MRRLRPYIAVEIEPGPGKTGDDDLLAHARGSTILLPSGSCTMGPASNPMAVVDPEIRIHGLEALSVADTGVMPTVVSGTPTPPAS